MENSKNLEEIKKYLEDLHPFNTIFDELDANKILENSINVNSDTFIKTASVISEIKDKQDITQRLDSLMYSIKWLKSGILIRDSIIIETARKNVLKNKYSSINSIISELNSLKENINNLEDVHSDLLKTGLSLDIKALMEQDFAENRKKLNELHLKQKNILLSLSKIFINLTKGPAIKKK